jgi:iron complex transport system substrate-binding protein
LKKLILILLFTLCLLVTAACGSGEEINGGDENLAESPDTERPEMPAEDEAIVIIDQSGREVVLSGSPQRIISLSPSNTEVLFALGLEDRLVGVTEYCNYPPEAQEKAIIGGFATPSIEKIIELEPDLVLASTIHEEDLLPLFDELGITVMVVESSTLLELFTTMSLVAEVSGVTAAGEALIASMQERINAVEAVIAMVSPAERTLVYYEVYSDPLMSAGQGAFINEIIQLAGGVNIFNDITDNYPEVSAEVVVERQPEVILFPDYHGTADLVLETMTGRPGWESVPAVISGRVYAISDDAFARPGPRVVEAVEEAAVLFYPELFPTQGE